MIIQIINLSLPDKIYKYCTKYKIRPDVFSHGILFLELRDVSSEMTEEYLRIFLKRNELFYKFEDFRKGTIDLCINGSIDMLKNLSKKLLSEGYHEVGNKIINVIRNYEDYDRMVYLLGEKEFHFSRAYVMGILNVTPDSFSDGGNHFNKDNAVLSGLQLLEDGADILDIGGESTRPGADPVSSEEELNRILKDLREKEKQWLGNKVYLARHYK